MPPSVSSLASWRPHCWGSRCSNGGAGDGRRQRPATTPPSHRQEESMSATSRPPQRQPDGTLTLIGRKEFVEFPEWGVGRIRAKVDTGAYSSALGVAAAELIMSAAGMRVRFQLPGRRG